MEFRNFFRNREIFTVIAGWLLAGWTSQLTGGVITLHPANSPQDRPISQALQKAAEGDVIQLAPGEYREAVVVEKRLTIRGGPGVVWRGDWPVTTDWEPAGDDLPGVFTATFESRPAGLLHKSRFVAELRFDRAQKPGDWHWMPLMKKGPPLSGFDEIKALWMYHERERRAYLRPPDGGRPERGHLTFIPADRPLIQIRGAKGVVLEGLELAAGATAISIGTGADGTVVRHCRITSYEDTGISISGGAGGCLVEGCEITRGALEEWSPSLEHNRANYEIWRIHKDVGKYDRVAINLFRAGAGNRILNNRMDRVFDGICVGDHAVESLDKPLTDPAHGQGTEIAGNTIEHTRDSGIELGVGCVNVHVHHNVLTRTHGGFRFKVPRIGPVFIHHNRLVDGSPFNFWFSMDASPAEGYIYHNTIIGKKPAFSIHLKDNDRGFSIPQWHFLNNLILTKEGYFDPPGKGLPVDFTSAHNVATGGGRPWKSEVDATKDRGSRYQSQVPLDASGRPGGDAIDAGMDLSTYRQGKPLPGTTAGGFQGEAPDAGDTEVR